MQQHKQLVVILETAIIAAFAMALTYIPHTTGVSAIELNYGLIPIAVLAMRRGLVPAAWAGFVWGILDLILRGIGGGSVLNPLQGILEYPIAFTLVGLMGLTFASFQKAARGSEKVKASGYAFAGIIIGTFAKYFIHFIAGVVFWGAYAPKGTNVWVYSLIVNGGSALFSTVLTIVVVGVLLTVAPQLFVAKGGKSFSTKAA
ncbi:energy-coupled thiamine transporter ThiT [Lacticaseibacillus paracasei]|uniref:energy-coupled thiamine transporter ThiT n=1 Tax=Lacticaseibacillus paracasei TaxID=1597 RepID=UPI0009C3938E|nr:energy-coupled thiamine transporter ThiT [Lacticaseibacillus paracasei]ARE42565.1 energy-coupled thiamine transporter ThiT [Lacticaseibacillus paracasei]ARE45279.1 energy-coupled thiamine transporter ThiT [Lacticaseibacillus paracasei]